MDLTELTKVEATTSDKADPDAMLPKYFPEVEGEVTLIGGHRARYGLLIIKAYEDKERKVRIYRGDRDYCNLAFRFIYSLATIFYKVIWFYFAPFSAFILSYWIPFKLGGYEGTRSPDLSSGI